MPESTSRHGASLPWAQTWHGQRALAGLSPLPLRSRLPASHARLPCAPLGQRPNTAIVREKQGGEIKFLDFPMELMSWKLPSLGWGEHQLSNSSRLRSSHSKSLAFSFKGRCTKEGSLGFCTSGSCATVPGLLVHCKGTARSKGERIKAQMSQLRICRALQLPPPPATELGLGSEYTEGAESSQGAASP